MHHLVAEAGRPVPIAAPIYYGCTALNRGVSLSFDDGPSNATSVLLDTLRDRNISATFFVVGANAVLHPHLVRRAFAEGHTIASHTWTHANLTRLFEAKDWEALKMEVDETSNLIEKLVGVRPHLIRPPYGAVTPGLAAWLAAKNLTVVLWNGGCVDWWLNDIGQSAPYIINGMADAGALLCFHDSYSSTCEGISLLLDQLTASAQPQVYANPQGRRIISLQECLPGVA